MIENSELIKIYDEIKERIKEIQVIAISNVSQTGIEEVKSNLNKGKTYCLLGSSGVGKSSLINQLVGENLMSTGEISESINRGKHITTHRELIVSEHGILIDNPGMREVGITSSQEGLEITFDEILSLSYNCKFKDCSHTNEIGCAVLEALENEEIDSETYQNFQKMQKERDFFESNSVDRKKKDKSFGKMIKNVKKQRKKDKY